MRVKRDCLHWYTCFFCVSLHALPNLFSPFVLLHVRLHNYGSWIFYNVFCLEFESTVNILKCFCFVNIVYLIFAGLDYLGMQNVFLQPGN